MASILLDMSLLVCVCVCVCEADCCDSLLPVVLDVLQSGINASHSLFNIVRGEELWGGGILSAVYRE